MATHNPGAGQVSPGLADLHEQADRQANRVWNEPLKDPRAFKAQIYAARLLHQDELVRHASVSTNNRHHCRSCFTCACEVVRQERAALADYERKLAAIK